MHCSLQRDAELQNVVGPTCKQTAGNLRCGWKPDVGSELALAWQLSKLLCFDSQLCTMTWRQRLSKRETS